MIKLVTPPGMLLTVALLAIYAVYAFQLGSIEESWILIAGGVLSVVASYGTAMLRPWSQYLVYGLTIGLTGKLGQSIYQGIASGFFDFHFGSARAAIYSLMPSIAIVLLSGLCCFLVFRHFHDRPYR